MPIQGWVCLEIDTFAARDNASDLPIPWQDAAIVHSVEIAILGGLDAT
jgi:hypothetical protein